MVKTVTSKATSQLWQRWHPWIVVGVVSFLLLLIRFVGFEPQLRKWLETGIQPLSLVGAELTFVAKGPVETFLQTRKLQYRVRDIEVRYAELLTEVGELQQLQAENEALRAMIENTDRELAPTIVAAPITAFGSTYLAAGSEAGVSPGDPVLVGRVLLGTVAEVSPMQSQVLLLRQPQDQPVLAQTGNGATGLVTGDGRRVLLTEIENQESELAGEVVTTVGQPGVPPNLLIGQVVSVLDDPTASSQQAVIDQAISFYDSSLVEIRPQNQSKNE